MNHNEKFEANAKAVVLTNEVTGIPGFPHPLLRQIMMICMGIYRNFDDNS